MHRPRQLRLLVEEGEQLAQAGAHPIHPSILILVGSAGTFAGERQRPFDRREQAVAAVLEERVKGSPGDARRGNDV